MVFFKEHHQCRPISRSSTMPNKLSKSTILHTNIIDLNFLLPKRGLLVKAGGIRDFLPVIVEEAEADELHSYSTGFAHLLWQRNDCSDVFASLYELMTTPE